MSKHNYSQYYNKNKNNKPAEEVVEEVEVTELEPTPVVEPEAPVVEPVVEPAVEPEVVPVIPDIGVVINCTRLNVRANPVADAKVLCVLEAKSEVEIDMARSTSDWYHVITATGIDGFCMKRFVELKK